MRHRFHVCICAALIVFGLSACSSRRPLNPPTLVTARDTDMAIQLFMQATILLARKYGFETLDYAEIRDRSVRHGYDVIPFMAPVATHATPPFTRRSLPSETNFSAPPAWLAEASSRQLIRYYVTTGLRASQLICRNYMIGLDEGNRYLDFLQTEFNIGSGLANAFLTIAHANFTAMSVLHGVTVGTNLATDAYQEYRFLAIDRDVAVALIDTAQNKIASDFLASPDIKGATFSDAVQVVSSIEYQCTRSGIRSLITNAAKEKTEKLGVPKSEAPKSTDKAKTAATPSSAGTATTLQPK